MEGIASRKDARERLHRRALSQASTASSTMHSPKTTKSTSTSSSHPRAITPSNAPHTHRYHHSQCDREMAGIRQPARLSRETSSESKQPMTPTSSLLQERLQQERKAESERLASRWGADLSLSTGDIREGDISNSSGRRYRPGSERRPGSSHDDDSSQTSMGAKQAEKAVSTLHKQNFDLKLELFHRREKQSALEAQVEELVNERAELAEIQESLLSELVKRDKAIEEAVNMIVQLEARVDELVQEKEIMRRTETDGSYRHSWSNLSDSLRAETPKPGDHGALLSIEPKTLERMPSFLSDRSAYTQNLRSIVLQNRSSLLHIRKVSEVSASSADVSEVNRVASPSLSMLSESSFVSIYGSKQGQEGTGLPPLGDVLGMDGTFGNRSPTPTMTRNPMPSQKTSSPGHTLNSTPRVSSGLSSQVISANNVPRRESRLHRMEKRGERASNSVDETFRPHTYSRGRVVVTPTSQFMASPSQAGSKRERRDTLPKVLTNYPTQKELSNAHPLPPTPDTVSSSVLRKHKDPSSSQDSLSRSDDVRLLTTSLPHGTEYLRSLANQEARSGTNAPQTRLSPPPRNHGELPASGFMKIEKSPLMSDLGQLARSAANTAARPRSGSFASDSDSDGGADARSETESCDYWMRESYKPEKNNVHSSSRLERRRSPSPDLFSFPGGSAGWEPDAMFGALKGGGFLGSPAPALKRDPVDELASSFQSPPPEPIESTTNGPPAPSRRSSLNAQAASRFLLSSLTGKTGRSSSRDDSAVGADTRGRSNSVDGSGHAALPGTRADAGPTKRSQYPPISGLQPRGRNLGLNSLFRRSGSESHGTPSSATESTFPPSVSQRGPPALPAQLRHLQKPSGRSSVPPPATMPWAIRPAYVADDEFASATPPPILRNRPPALETDLATSDVTTTSDTSQAAEAGAVPVTPSTEARSTTPVAPQSGGDTLDNAQGPDAATDGVTSCSGQLFPGNRFIHSHLTTAYVFVATGESGFVPLIERITCYNYLCTVLGERTPLISAMAKAIRSIKTKAGNDGANRRRSAKRLTLEETNEIAREDGVGNESDEIAIKNENEGTSPPKATTKRGLGLTDSFPAAELRRSKRIKSDNAPKQYEQLKGETAGKKVKMKKEVKLEDDGSLQLVKAEADDNDDDKLATPSKVKAAVDLQAKKLKSYSQFAAAQQSPYPDFPRPRPGECKLAHRILVSIHGEQKRPEEITAPASRAGCGDSASVLDALVRTILSQNTSNANSTRAKLSMDAVYGGSDAWEAIAAGGEAKLAKAIESGGLASVKSKVILAILQQTREKYGTYSLDHLFHASSDEAMRELISFKGVGPKTASCVLLFCLCRPSFAVDTHVHRITGLLGWRPAAATRDQTHAHLDARIPDEDKYGLHVLFVQHGRECEECRAGGKSLGRCELRKAFRKGKEEGEGEEAGDKLQQIKAKEDDTDSNAKG
ncbi:hypothetical protein GQX73_g7566 [Xylaria multiplex]|uniref:HhH-GPD domain-containing protein n=1 Tax=Xylaria multiplex TaxID=323545 RepID=A0A7C8IKV0_9PEZI|nr:hypothetical protein GQX73_g7566 [Xylaria multiplex]